MKSFIKLLLVIFLFFSATFAVIKFSGVLTAEQIESWFAYVGELNLLYVGILITLFLFADLFIAIPTLTVTLLAGYFLGHSLAVFFVSLGMFGAATCGYFLSHKYGQRVFRLLMKKENDRNEAIDTFKRHGFSMVLLSRAIPILPEATACLAGLTKMPFKTFILAWSISSLPYIIIASYAGSISTVENPQPAIYTAIGLTLTLWLTWYMYRKASKVRIPN
ncbi:TVP38/TMEM64 family protein [Psychrobium sp. 1_MG-2023]|uniref:TVP38/TMEM64 family protein n=1 Tax=Psychrobium sp. 1_MG-2023 TaxID=3062624 RepID=UPI000C32ADE1|nr:VTT domain-containing protein [Psychrobium sp. 1_MG-2023]MDP2560073.1 VTT domain-containing protein [Psychrobium sp. 1_MG-2023]PKF56267.1 hypothetical protein CW748_09890 [Alteromonadales bacterium alter-6D02]